MHSEGRERGGEQGSGVGVDGAFGCRMGVSWEHVWEIQIGTRALKEERKTSVCVLITKALQL